MNKYFLSFLSGALLPLAFAPFRFWPLAFLSLAIFIIQLHKKTIKQAWHQGFIFGLGFFGIGISWVFVSIHDFGHSHFLVAALITIAFVLYLACFTGLHAVLFKWLHSSNNQWALLVTFPTLWVLLEMLRSWLLTGFPWLILGTSQIESPLHAAIPLIGNYGVSFLVVQIAGLFVLAAQAKQFKPGIIGLIILSGCVFSISNKQWTQQTPELHSVTMVQGNLKPDAKFLLEEPLIANWTVYGEPTTQINGSDLVIWPENSLALATPHAFQYLKQLNEVAKSQQISLVLGMPIETNTPDSYFNSIKLLGTKQGEYHKQKLVPFGDYVPFEHWLRGLFNFLDLPMSNFVPGDMNQPSLSLPHSTALPLVCYEMAYANFVRDRMQQTQADVILTVSEDGWFGNSIGPHQHLDIARVRALETGRYVLRSTTSGITAIINPQGQIVQQAPQFKQTMLHGSYQNSSGITPWLWLGQTKLLFLLLLWLLPALLQRAWHFYSLLQVPLVPVDAPID